MTECRYELKDQLQYSYKGEMKTASFITMTAPSFKQLKDVTPIKQALMSAITEVSADTSIAEIAGKEAGPAEPAEADGIDAQTIMQLLYRWSGDLTAVMRKAESLFKSGAALIDGETMITNALLEKMSLKDFEGLVGAYLANFIVPSLTDGQ